MDRDSRARPRPPPKSKLKTSSWAGAAPQASVITAGTSARGEHLEHAVMTVDAARSTTSDRRRRGGTKSKPRLNKSGEAGKKTRSSRTKVSKAERKPACRPSRQFGGPVANTLESVGALSQIAAEVSENALA